MFLLPWFSWAMGNIMLAMVVDKIKNAKDAILVVEVFALSSGFNNVKHIICIKNNGNKNHEAIL